MPGMRRREFVSLFGGAAASSPAWSRVAHAQQRTPTIGFLGVSTAASWTDWTAAFVSRLGELGWTDGRNVAIEYRWAGGLAERYAEIAAEFVRRKVDIIVTGGIAVPAAKQATSTIPIVFALAADPLAGSLVTSLARPGGNVTGLSAQSSGTASKRVEILREIIPSLRRIAVIGNAAYAASVEEIVNEAKKARADLIVMGSHGKSALRAAVLGSVTYGVMHKDSKIPVLIVRR
jgi:putative ABC transport system substrate-binding protein